MHDFTLGPPVDTGEYGGPLIDGRPLHEGSCEDGVYGCRSCNAASRKLTDEQLTALGWPCTGECDFCHAHVHVRDICGLMDHEDHTYHEVCRTCKDRHVRAVLKEIEEERDRYPEPYDEEW